MTKIGFPQRNIVVVQGDLIPVISSHPLSWQRTQEPSLGLPYAYISQEEPGS